MNKETAFLNCDILSVYTLESTDDHFHLIDKIYYHNSLDKESINFQYVCIQIPHYEVTNYHLLRNLDYDLVYNFRIPLIKRIVNSENEFWEIDLKYYENYKLQSRHVQ
jgi:hypothetical protein